MKPSIFAIFISLIASFLLGAQPANSGQTEKAAPAGSKGSLEIECNIADVDLKACPLDNFERKSVRKFFGLFTSYQESCTMGQLVLGTTPLKPIELPEGKYVLFIPEDYAWEHKGPIEVNVAAQQKTFFLLKLFRRYQAGGNGGGPGGGGGGGAGAGGGAGSPPP